MSNLFNPDHREYCCGEKADKKRFAERWVQLLNAGPTTERAEKTARGYITEVYKATKILPRVNTTTNGGFHIRWNSAEHVISLHLDAENPTFDTLSVDYSYYIPVDVEAIKRILVI